MASFDGVREPSVFVFVCVFVYVFVFMCVFMFVCVFASVFNLG